MDKRLKLFLALLFLGALVVGGVLVKAYLDSKKLPEFYTVATEANEKGENFSANVHLRETLLPTDKEFFSYDKVSAYAPVYAMNFPYQGFGCSELSYTTYLDGDVMIIDQKQEKKCDKPQTYFVTTLLLNSGKFSQIKVNQWIDEDLVNFYEFDIDPTKDVWPANTDLVVEQ
jgi:hypothetical protein